MKHRHKVEKKERRHVRLYHWLMDTAAWKSLDPVARAIYVELAARYAGSNNGRIALSSREAAGKVGVSKATAARGLAELKERGFVALTRAGHFDLKGRQSSEYRLTEFPCDGELATKDFYRWADPITPAKKDSTVSPVRLTGSVVRPYGVCGETVHVEKGSDGARGETVRAVSAR